MYFDTSYIAKFYMNEPESARVADLVRKAGVIHSSVWAITEFHSVLHRRLREGLLTSTDARDTAAEFAQDIADGLWNLIPVSESLLRRTSTLILAVPATSFIRTADAVHLATASEIGERDIWTNDRHMLAAASYFGLTSRVV
ncbi:MAG TPA: type II toxin-antitoxin system VapC family toxin [Bryobacteraceae bacterium]|nr:type II toxin-antitoxin system VapC family toxin [Bryobacteraceae bacterium]